MRRMVLYLLLCAACLTGAACAKGGEPPRAEDGFHGGQGGAAEAPARGMIPVIQGQRLAQYPGATIGAAFGAYPFFDRKEWKEARAEGGKCYVDYVGWYRDGVPQEGAGTVNGVEVKFVIYPDGAFNVAMVSKIASGADGTLSAYPLADSKRVIDAIYANEKIRF